MTPRFWLGFWATIAVAAIALAMCTARSDAVLVRPCERADAFADRLVLSAEVARYAGLGIQEFVDAAWRISGGGHAPRADGMLVAWFPNGMVGVYPVSDGWSCAALLVSRRKLDAAISVFLGEPV